MAILDHDMFLQIRDELTGCKAELVEIAPGYEVKVVQLTAEAGFGLLTRNEKESEEVQKREGSYAWVAACCRDDNNEQVFSVDDLKSLPFGLVQKLISAVNKVNGIASADGLEEAEKNSEVAIS